MIKLDEIKEYLYHKSIAVIGNSSNLLNNKHGSLIDTHDVVLRMNHGYPRAHTIPYTGKSTHLWACSYNNQRSQVHELNIFKPKYILHLPRDKRYIHKKLLPILYSDSEQNYLALKKQLTNANPSTGCLVLYFMLITLSTVPKKLSVFGFDFFNQPNFYCPQRQPNFDWHSPQVEAIFLTQLIQKNEVLWIK